MVHARFESRVIFPGDLDLKRKFYKRVHACSFDEEVHALRDTAELVYRSSAQLNYTYPWFSLA